MKRFTNILVLYDFEMGADEAVQRGVNLARRNNAELTILNVVEDSHYSLDAISERRKLLERLCAGFKIDEDHFRLIIKGGEKIEEALSYIDRLEIDLVIMPTERGKGFDKLIGKDTTAELLRGVDCPIWVVRPDSAAYYRTIVAAVNAGKKDALTCPINRRLIELGASLAEMEMADFKILYVWDYEPKVKERLSSEIPDDVRQSLFEEARYKALEDLVKLASHVLGDPMKAIPVVKQGDVEEGIYDYLEEVSADMLVSEGTPTSPLMDALVGNRGLHILNHAQCSVLVSRP